MDLTQYIRDIPDFPKPGILFKDITPLLAEPDAFQYAIDRLAEHYPPATVDAVAAVEARGFLFAAPLALELQKPLIPLRKPGKLPYQTHTLQYDLEYGSAELQIHIDAVTSGAGAAGRRPAGDRRDDGGRLAAGRESGRRGDGLRFLVELGFLGGRDKLKPYEVFSLIRLLKHSFSREQIPRKESKVSTRSPGSRLTNGCAAMNIDFDKAGGLVPAIAQDADTGVVLMLAWMNREAYEETVRTRRAVYFSRSRNRLWRKGEESGNVQEVRDIYLDCDADTILLKVHQIGGAACHEGYRACFFRRVEGGQAEGRLAKGSSIRNRSIKK